MDTNTFATDHRVGLADVQNDGIIAVMVRLFAILKDALDTVRKARSGNSLGVKAAVQHVARNNSEASSVAYDLADRLRAGIFAAIEDCPDVSVLLPDILSEISEEVRDVRKLVMAGLDIEDSSSEEDETDVSEALAIANFAKELLNNYSTLLSLQGHNLGDLPQEMLRTNKAGETALSLPKVPSMSNENTPGTGAGRPVQTAKFRFTLNKQEIPTSGFDRLAVFYCSTHTDRINGSELKELIKRQTGKDWSDKGNEQFTVVVPAGTLTATAVNQ